MCFSASNILHSMMMIIIISRFDGCNESDYSFLILYSIQTEKTGEKSANAATNSLFFQLVIFCSGFWIEWESNKAKQKKTINVNMKEKLKNQNCLYVGKKLMFFVFRCSFFSWFSCFAFAFSRYSRFVSSESWMFSSFFSRFWIWLMRCRFRLTSSPHTHLRLKPEKIAKNFSKKTANINNIGIMIIIIMVKQ